MTIECRKECNPRDGHVIDCPRAVLARQAEEKAEKDAQEATTAPQRTPPKPSKEQQPHVRESSYASPPPANPVEPVQVIARPIAIESVVHPPLPTQGGSAVQVVKTTATPVQSGARAPVRARTPEQAKAEWDAAQPPAPTEPEPVAEGETPKGEG